MAYCPNCETEIAASAEECPACGAQFLDGGWTPLEEKTRPTPKPKSAINIVVKLGIASALLPIAAFIIGWILRSAIPGCACDEGAGCHGCGINGLLENLIFGGFIGALVGTIFVFPCSLLLGAIFDLFQKRR